MSLKTIGEALLNVVVEGARVPIGIVNVSGGRGVAPSWSASVAAMVPPHEPVATKVNGFETAGPPVVTTPYTPPNELTRD